MLPTSLESDNSLSLSVHPVNSIHFTSINLHNSTTLSTFTTVPLIIVRCHAGKTLSYFLCSLLEDFFVNSSMFQKHCGSLQRETWYFNTRHWVIISIRATCADFHARLSVPWMGWRFTFISPKDEITTACEVFYDMTEFQASVRWWVKNSMTRWNGWSCYDFYHPNVSLIWLHTFVGRQRFRENGLSNSLWYRVTFQRVWSQLLKTTFVTKS